MQEDYLFFVTSSYIFAGATMAGLACVVLFHYLRTKKRFNALERKRGSQ